MHTHFLIGEHIYLRPIERPDAPQFVAWLNDAEITRNTLQYLPINLRFEEEWIDKLCRDAESVVVGIVEKATDRLIGATGLHKIDQRNRHASFGITIGAKELWGQGYGTEATRLMVRYAFQTLNLNRIWLHVYEFNVRAVRAYEKAGFKKEGVLRQDAFRDGRYWDTITMAVLRDEWQG